MALLKTLALTVVVCVTLGVSIADDVSPSTLTSLIMGPASSSSVGPVEPDQPSTTMAPAPVPKPKMYSMHVTSHIEYRFANTLISSRVANPATVAQEVYFSVTLPETAFISKFLMEVDGKVYEASVKEKEEAKQVYDQAVASGQGAAHVAVSARDSNRFTVNVNIEPQSKVNFNLTYEELLTRRLGAYNHVINLDPGQLVRDLKVDVYIKENRNITTLRVPELRSGNEVDANESSKSNPLATIERKNAHEAHISFAPTEEQQKTLGRAKGLDAEVFGRVKNIPEGLGGQFVVQYDVERDPLAGDVLIDNGYFVHFFAPKDLPPLRKHALFVLDVSGSMEGRKIEQLKDAMNAILDDLNEGDYFNIIEFSYSVTVWNLDATASSAVFSPYSSYHYDDDAAPPNAAPTPAFPATPEYIAKAKEIVTKMRAGGGTNIYDTLKTVIRVAHEGLQNVTVNNTAEEKRNPIIVFLTDGEPTVGETRLNKIFSIVQELNSNPEAALFSLAFGDDADLDFLKKLSLKNSGFARKIYEASDAALQLRDFYRQIASPLLANVTFNYQPDKIVQDATTKTHFHTLFSGSEIVVAGRIKTPIDAKPTDDAIQGQISGFSHTGDSIYPIPRPWPVEPKVRDEVNAPVTSLERLWAYLTIQQLLESQDSKSDEDTEVKDTGANNETALANTTTTATKDPKKEALKLALQYSFVTSLTSLVVVKPNKTKQTGGDLIEPASGSADQFLDSAFHGAPVDRISSHYPQPISAPGPMYSSQPTSGLSGSFPAAAQGGPGYGGTPLSVGGFGGPGSYPGQSGSPASSSSSGSSGYYPPRQPVYQTPGRPGLPGQQGYPGTPGRHPISVSPPQPSRPSVVAYEEETAVESDSDHVPFESKPSAISTTPRPRTTSITPLRKDPVLINLEELEWLDAVLNGTDITLPFDVNGASKTYHLELNNQTLGELHDCRTPTGGEGQCRHLSQCSLSAFKHDVQSYKKYFCEINSFAGACCPKNLFPHVTTEHIPLVVDDVTPNNTTAGGE